ncbi:MAG TPA: DnaJ domain-containing protein [Thermoanaerobaculia bacterium]|nr:DnaJ domain-containing protein [Thermoanaerobaculia bacterium]
MTAEKQNYYAILGVVQEATEAQIRARFKELVRRHHPDRFVGGEKLKAEERFQAITEAVNVLTSPTRRRDHDFELAQHKGGERRGQDGDRVAQAYLQRGAKAYRDRNWVQAADNFHRATEAQPQNARAFYLLALACIQNRRFKQQAVNAISRACELEPINVEYLTLGGRILAEAGLAAKAEKFYTAALRWGGPDPAIEEALRKLRNPRS